MKPRYSSLHLVSRLWFTLRQEEAHIAPLIDISISPFVLSLVAIAILVVLVEGQSHSRFGLLILFPLLALCRDLVEPVSRAALARAL
jgi:hypothetical protein